MLKRAVRRTDGALQRRAAAPRLWSGPLISRAAEPTDAYLEHVRLRLADPRAQLYFDTSFLMWLAKASAAARAEFVTWLATLGPSRVHVPLWSAHEFFKHRLKRTVAGELNAEVAKFDKAATSMFDVLGIYASNELFGIDAGVEALLDEYRRAVQPLRSLLTLATKSSCLDAAVQEVAELVDAHLLPGPLDMLLAGIEDDERARFRGSVPPAFNDAHKRQRKSAGEPDEKSPGDNSFGDLVFWREVLRHAGARSASATIVLTKDRKNDWFENDHGDAGFPEDLRRVVRRPRPVPRAHPLLIREAFDRGAGELLLMDPMYFAILFERAGVERRNFSRAALAPSLPAIPRKSSDLQKWAGRFGSAARPLGDVNLEPEVVDEGDAELDLSLDLASPNIELQQITVRYLRYLRDSASRDEALSRFAWEVVARRNLADIVAIGRAIFTLAETGEPKALSILSDLREQAPTLPNVLRQTFLFGALSAAYFDDDLTYRPRSDPTATAIALDLVTSEGMSKAVDAIGDAVQSTPAIYSPSSETEQLSVDVVIQSAADGKTRADLLAIRVEGIDLMTTTQDDPDLQFATLLGKEPGGFDTPVGALLAEVARHHRIPRHLMVPSVEPDAVVRVGRYAGVDVGI